MRGLIGGAWRYGTAKSFEGDISFYYVNNDDPIAAGASNFDVHDEMYYDLDMDPEAKVLAATWTPDARAQKNGRAFPHIYNVAPQIWTFENKGSRAFVDLLGHNYATFGLPQVRAVLLRGIAWAGKRENLDEFCSKEELASLRYPPGGPSRPPTRRRSSRVHPDFKATLVAAEPLINKPIALDWDARGRLWVAETPEYPNGRRGMRADFARRGMEGPRRPRPEARRAGAPGARPHQHPHRQQGRRGHGQEAGLLRGARARHRLRLLQGRRDRRRRAGHPLAARYGRRRQGRQGGEALHRPRHARHARGDQQSALGLGRLDLRHARLQRQRSRDQRRRQARLRPHRLGRGALQAGRLRHRAILLERRQHLGPRDHRRTTTSSGRSRRAAICSCRRCCPRPCSRAGGSARPRASRSSPKPEVLPADDVGAAGLSADRFGRLLHRRGRLRDLRRRLVAGELERQLLLHRADDQYRAPRAPRPRGRELHVPQGAGPRGDGIHPLERHVVPPDRSARRAGRRALRARFLQPGGDPQRHARPRAQQRQRRRAPGSRPLLRPHLADRSPRRAEADTAGSFEGDGGRTSSRP